MTPRLAAIGIVVLLLGIFLLYQAGEYALCVNRMRNDSVSVDVPVQQIRAYCWGLRNPFNSI